MKKISILSVLVLVIGLLGGAAVQAQTAPPPAAGSMKEMRLAMVQANKQERADLAAQVKAGAITRDQAKATYKADRLKRKAALQQVAAERKAARAAKKATL